MGLYIFFTFLTPLITSKLRGVSELGVQSACLSLRHCLRPGRDLWPPFMCVPADFTSGAPSPSLPIPWLFKDILSLSPSPENGILLGQPQMPMSQGRVVFPRPLQGAHCSWIVTFGLAVLLGDRCPVLGTSFDICSLVNEVDLETLVNATDGRENMKAYQKVQFIIKHLPYAQYSIVRLKTGSLRILQAPWKR